MANPDDFTSRGKAIKSRRLRHGIKSVREFAEGAEVSREAVARAEAGSASAATYDRLEAWLDNFEEESGSNDPAKDDLVEYRLSGNFGVDVVVRGPVSDLDALEASVARLMRQMSNQPPR